MFSFEIETDVPDNWAILHRANFALCISYCCCRQHKTFGHSVCWFLCNAFSRFLPVFFYFYFINQLILLRRETWQKRLLTVFYFCEKIYSFIENSAFFLSRWWRCASISAQGAQNTAPLTDKKENSVVNHNLSFIRDLVHATLAFGNTTISWRKVFKIEFCKLKLKNSRLLYYWKFTRLKSCWIKGAGELFEFGWKMQQAAGPKLFPRVILKYGPYIMHITYKRCKTKKPLHSRSFLQLWWMHIFWLED